MAFVIRLEYTDTDSCQHTHSRNILYSYIAHNLYNVQEREIPQTLSSSHLLITMGLSDAHIQ